MHCLIGLNGSWAWFNDFEETGVEGELRVAAGAASIKEEDTILYLLPPEFQPEIAFTVLDPKVIWTEQIFGAGLAASSRILGTDGQYWRHTRPIDDPSELKDGETLQTAGWDHEHCTLCMKHIYPELTHFRHEHGEFRFFLCAFCHDRFAVDHRIAEVIYPTMGVRSDEED
jgi:hypothetical protein